ncbi:hypothetical protein FAO10_24895 [Klebsiella pneumoniae subsp. pneumoniae]|nr:hypothetical protein FAO10_24895 [Klebsiella pneumoniae subsp. pneumoniae]
MRDLILQLSKSSIYSTKPFLPHNTVTNHLNVVRQKASSATSIIPGRCYFLPGISTLYAA